MAKFYTVVRQFFKGDAETHSMEVKTDYNEALQRYFNIIAADLAATDITYNAAYIIDSNGMMTEGRVFDHTVVPESEAVNEA